jgi:uncharacterized protein YutE (UPF0331/DUF86 family)/predicted nucleotidyltransferase
MNQITQVEMLKGYFEKKEGVVMAFLFGSQASGLVRKISDWDIGVYFKPYQYMEIETRENYPGEENIWGELVSLLKTDDVDLAILNRTSPSVVFSVLSKGIPLKIKDRRLYLDLLCRVSYEAIDFWDFAWDFYKISERAKSLTPEEKTRLIQFLKFLENEFNEIKEIKKITWEEYRDDSFKRKIVERWVENLVMSSLDIAKIILASEKKGVPQSYKETLENFGLFYFKEEFARRFSRFASLRNIVVHQYLDIKWMQIKDFIKEAEELYPLFIRKIKELLNLEASGDFGK